MPLNRAGHEKLSLVVLYYATLRIGYAVSLLRTILLLKVHHICCLKGINRWGARGVCL